MYLTSDEAKEKYCMFKLSEPYHSGNFCIGDQCMAWREQITQEVVRSNNARCPPMLVDSSKTGKGYCGMVLRK